MTLDMPVFDPYSRAFQRDPYPTYATLRERSPLLKVQPFGNWWVFCEQDVRAVLTDKDLFRKNPTGYAAPRAPAEVFDADEMLPAGPFHADEPWHATLRQLLGPPFAASIATAGSTARALAQALLAKLPTAGGRAELIAAYALPLPAQVLFTVLGLPPKHWENLIRWITPMIIAHDIRQAPAVRWLGGTASMALGAYYQGMLRRPLPTSTPQGLVDRLMAAPLPDGMGVDALQNSLVSITMAGYLSTTFLIGTGLKHLLAHPEAIERLLLDDPVQDRVIVQELLRLDAPAQIVDRVVAQPTQLGGVALQAGEELSLVLGSANRDPRIFAAPDAFRLDRKNAERQLSFGDGIHHCIGHALASQVAPIALRELLRRLKNLRIDGVEQWQTDPYLRGHASLPIAWGP